MRLQKSKGSYSPTSFSFTLYNRSLKFTREGVFFVLLVLGIGFAAINTGINLLYLILAMCLSFIIVSGILSELTLRNIFIERTFPEDIFAEQPFPVQTEVKNKKKWFPSYSLWVEEGIESNIKNKGVILGSSAGFLSKDNDGLSIPKLYFYHIKAGESEKKTVLWVLPHRGLFKTRGLKISTRYPFGIFIKTALIHQPEERIIYPKIKDIGGLSDQFVNIGEMVSRKKGEGSDILGFRRFGYGDSSKMIHWKTSAKVNNLMIKEHFEEENRKIAIIFDNRINDEYSNKVYKKFNEGVTQTASLANYFIQNEYEVKIVTCSRNIAFGSGFGHLSVILSHLALLEPVNKKKDIAFQFEECGDSAIRLSYSGEYL